MQVCTTCVLPGAYPGITFDEKGVCNFCNEAAPRVKNDAEKHFRSEGELIAHLEKYKNINRKYDVLVPVSGGVDSCSALIDIVEKFGLKPLVFHNDHGFDDETATGNVKKLCRVLDVDLLIWQYEPGYMKKLFKYFNEADVKDLSTCHVCGSMLYFNALQLADRFDIKLVINGYSKGQAAFIADNEKARQFFVRMLDIIAGDEEFLETFTSKYKMLDKQKKYVCRGDLEDDVDEEKILVIPFYIFKFYKTDKEALKKRCMSRFDWRQMETTYPDRTTNCEMIWLNTYVDLKKSRHSLYQDEYSTMVRAGDMTREQALRDLEFNPPEGLLERLAADIGLDLAAVRDKNFKADKGEVIKAESKISRDEPGDFGF